METQINKLAKLIFKVQKELFTNSSNYIFNMKIAVFNINEDYRDRGANHTLEETIKNGDFKVEITHGLHCALLVFQYPDLAKCSLEGIKRFIYKELEDAENWKKELAEREADYKKNMQIELEEREVKFKKDMQELEDSCK